MDFRKQWFQSCILNYLDETDEELMNIFFNRNNKEMGQKFDSFLNDHPESIIGLCNQVFVIYKTYYSKMVEEEIEVQEEVTKQRSSSVFGQSDKKRDKKGKRKKKSKKVTKADEDEDEDVDELLHLDDFDAADEDDDRKSKKIKKLLKSGGRISPSTMMEDVSQEEYRKKSQTAVSYITVKKKVQKVVQLPQLQGYFGVIEPKSLNSNITYIYFIKKYNRPIPNPCSVDEAATTMPSYFVIGSMTGDVLENVKGLLNLVFVPLFEQQIVEKRSENIQDEANDENVKFDGIILDRKPSYYFLRKLKRVDEPSKHMLLDADSSILKHLQQFVCPNQEKTWQDLLDKLIDVIDAVQWAQNELLKENQFVMPHTLQEFDWENGDVDETIKENAKSTVEIWINHLDSNFSTFSEIHKSTYTHSLLGEYEFWRNEETKLSTVVDELASTEKLRVINSIKEDNPVVFQTFQKKSARLKEAHQNAKENVEVLQTLHHFFKILTQGNFETITTILLKLMESLKSIWILSSYYSQEEHMQRILLNIKTTLCSRVKETFDVTNLFTIPQDDVNSQLSNAMDMLNSWKTSYLEVRARIESSRDYFIKRWEFDKQKLFSESDYICNIIKDLKNNFRIIHQYELLVKSKFKILIQPTEYETLESKIINMTMPVEKVDFDIYLEIFRDEWQEVMDILEESVIEIDQRLKLLTIKSLSKMKSVSEVIDVIEDISKIETRSAVQDSIPFICNKLISKFEREITITDQIFEKNKFNGDNQYKVYDFVRWSNDLVQNLQSTIVKFEKISNLCTTSMFDEILMQFGNFKSKVNQYIQIMVKDWSKKTIILIRETLKQNVLDIEEADKLLDLEKFTEKKQVLKVRTAGRSKISRARQTNEPEQNELSFGSLALTLKWISKAKGDIEKQLKAHRIETQKKIEQAHKISWLEFVGDSLLIEKGFRFKVKIQNEIFDAMDDVENLKQSDFKLPKEILEFLTIKSKLFENIEKIKNIITQYNSVIAKLEPTEILFMKQYFLQTEISIQPGLTLYTWRCTVLDAFCTKANQNLQKLLCLKYQMKRIFNKLDSFIIKIENINFLPVKKVEPEGLACQEFFQIVTNLQIEEIENCLEVYETISLTLIQCESLILHTNSGNSPPMKYFYTKYSEKIRCALKKSLLKSIDDLQLLFRGESPVPVYFLITSHLENGEIKLQPSCDELFEFVKITLIQTLTKLKFLKEWQDDSCIIKQNSEEMFYQRIINDQEIKEKSRLVLDDLQNLCDLLNESMKHWLKYEILWNHDKDTAIKQFASKKPELSDYEAQFYSYSSIASKIEQETRISLVCCVRIEVAHLMDQLQIHCTGWKNKLGFHLAAYTKQIILDVTETVQRLDRSLNSEITNEKDLINVLMSINEIEKIATDVSIKFYKIEEHYHELNMQNLKINEEDIRAFDDVKLMWEKIYDLCLYKKFVLESAKIKVADFMNQKVKEFKDKTDQFVASYRENKVRILTAEYDTTTEYLLEYSENCNQLYTEKWKVDKIHECFEISYFQLDDFLQVKTELDELKSKFKLL